MSTVMKGHGTLRLCHPIVYKQNTHGGRDGPPWEKTAVSLFPRPLQSSFLICEAVLRWFSFWGVSYLVAQIEPSFLRKFSYFSGTGEPYFLLKFFLTSGRPL